MFAKLLFKYIAFYKARRSLALGCSPRLIAGYMAQQRLLGESQSTAPALLVMGEETVKREEQPHGYNFKGVPKPDENGHRLVTLDRVWQLDDILVTSQPKDLCFSFALFKLLRCRFAKYTVSESGFMKAHNFFKDMLLQGDDSERVFRVVADELALIYYYYHSSLPIFYSSHLLLPIFTIAISLYNIGYCLFLMIFISRLLMNGAYNKIFCSFVCFKYNITDYAESGDTTVEYNSSTYYTDVVPAFLVLAALIFAETRDIVFYICSTWTKVALICNYVNRPSWQRCPAAQKCIAFVLQHFRCTMAGNNWGDNMKQFSILELHPKKFRFQLHKWKENSKIPSEVKAAIFETLKRKNLTTDLEGNLKVIRPPSSLFSSWAADHTGDSFLSAPDGKGAAYTILVWHIATTVFEIRRQAPPSSSDPHAIAATHLSHYCAYLVAFCPELLPSDEQWCKKMYMDVEKDAKRILKAVKGRKKQTGSHDQLCQLLTEDSSHEVLRNGARLGMQLADSATMGWEDLSRFWSEMILYVAPSENLDGHAQAIARGGELITLLWAMLAHAGILGRLDATAGDSDKAVTDTDGCAEV
ncbi:hypothetical protein HU200_065864 [Digitaria exilis]|uniref:DUF4220 domain-containing protein n=1 Tax=Digitaria exilis TaxID=1010633 RepID=A0A835DX51_9POAL|nr:hypothetical protein HU200_065864 [Digitaria exilis]